MYKETLIELKDFEEDMKWIAKNYNSLKSIFPYQWLAVINEDIVDHDTELDNLMNRLREKFPDNAGKIAVNYVTPEKVEMIL